MVCELGFIRPQLLYIEVESLTELRIGMQLLGFQLERLEEGVP
jgi:hypothetical protein